MLNNLKILYRALPSNFKKKLILVQTLVLISSVLEVVGVLSIGPFVQLISDKTILADDSQLVTKIYKFLSFNEFKPFLNFMIIYLLILFFSSTLFLIYNTYFFSKFAEEVGNMLRSMLFKFFIFQKWVFHSQNNSSNYTKKIAYETTRIANLVVLPILQLNAKVFTGLLIIISLIFYNPMVSFLCFCIFSISYWIIFRIFKLKLQIHGENLSIRQGRMYKVINETFLGIREVIIYGKQTKFTKKFFDNSFAYGRSQAVIHFLAHTPKHFLEFIAFGVLLVFLFIFVSTTSDANLFKTLPVLAIYIFAGYKLLPIFQQIYQGFVNLKANNAAIENLKYELKSISSSEKTEEIKDDYSSRLKMEDNIIFNEVSYKYSNAKKIAVKDINLEINSNSAISIVGPSGSGKTTILDLFLGLLTPQSGKILVDNKELDAQNIRQWQNNISFVGQNIFLLDDTIKNNICFDENTNQIDEKKLQDVIEKSDMKNFIDDLKEGLDTVIGERGLKLSGGQRQRIAIARAFYHDRQLIVFDEATNSLDGISEKIIIDQLNLLSKNKTVLLVTHNIKLTKFSSKIYILDEGSIIDSGSYENLKYNNIFQKLSNE